MQVDFVRIYSLIDVSPVKANDYALAMLEIAESQEEKDSINWARGYALVRLREFDEAKKLWLDLYERTKSPKTVHQLGLIEKAKGQYEAAIRYFTAEFALLEKTDLSAKATNLHELSRCHLLLGHNEEAFQYYQAYEAIRFSDVDLSERARFYLLQGDILFELDQDQAKKSYEESLKYFTSVNDKTGIIEAKSRLK